MSEEYKTQLKSEEEQRIEAERQLEFIEEARQIVGSISEKLGRPLFSVAETFGCEMNLETVIQYAQWNMEKARD